MRFHLVYSGRLPASGNGRPKPDDVRRIRDQFHPQMKLLWNSNSALQRLRRTAWVPRDPASFLGVAESPLGPDWDVDRYPRDEKDWCNLCKPIARDEKAYVPLVRESLHLSCQLNILFLRQEDPGALILQGGDLDGRIKTLFDALRMPEPQVERQYPQAENPLYCLLESDTLISGFEVSTGRLLTAETDRSSEVHLVIEASVKVLKPGPWNLCLMGD